MSTAPQEHLAYLDGWRGLAIAMVLENHFIGWLPMYSGTLGVDLFFALSGFLMSGLLFIKRQPLPVFYRRRISRILPAFVVFVLAMYLMALAQSKSFTPGELLATLTFTRTYLPLQPGIWDTGLPVGHLWSLNIEEHGYLFMSLLVLIGLTRTRAATALLLAGAGCLVIGVVYVRMGASAPHWGSLGSEVAASHLLISGGYRVLRERHGWRVPGWVPLLTLVLAVSLYLPHSPWWAQPLISPWLLALTVNHLADARPFVHRALAAPFLRQLGVWSFSLYLWQQPFYLAKHDLPGGVPVALLGAFAAAMLSFHALEQPARNWLNARWGASPAKPVPWNLPSPAGRERGRG